MYSFYKVFVLFIVFLLAGIVMLIGATTEKAIGVYNQIKLQ